MRVVGVRASESSVAMRGMFLHWEMRSGRRCQYGWRCGRWAWRRTLGGIRVERARRWMKLILTAGAQLASIALFRRAASLRGAYLGWQDDGSRWGRGLVRSSSPLSCEFLRPGSSAWQGALHFPELQHRHHERRRRPPQHTTATMSAVSRSIGSRLLAPALRPSATRAFAPAYRTYSTNEDTPHQHKTTSEDAPAVPLKSDSTQIRKESAAEGMRHAPDYNVAADYRTSCVTLERNHSRAS